MNLKDRISLWRIGRKIRKSFAKADWEVLSKVAANKAERPK